MSDNGHHIDINATPLQVAQGAYHDDVMAILSLAENILDPEWSDATPESYKLMHTCLGKIVAWANHAGMHVMEIESLS